MALEKMSGGKDSSGDMTQLPGEGTRGSIPMIIGLDFGTAFTKVVVAEPRQKYAIPFDIGGKSSYLLPCIFREQDDGVWDLGPGPGHLYTDLKMKILERGGSLGLRAQIVGFLALVLRNTRYWLLKVHRDTYQGISIDWHANIGLPTENYHDEDLAKLYRNLFMAAWNLSVQPGPITRTLARAALEPEFLERVPESRRIHPDLVALFPEFVSQVTGYVRSPLKREDLHMLMDVGAGTLDLTMFNVFRNPHDYESKFPIFTKGVQKLGTGYLMRHRAKSLGSLWKSIFDIQGPVPSQEEIAKNLGCDLERLLKVDRDFQRKVRKMLAEQLRETKARRYPTSPCWRHGIPVFLCGGGGKVDAYYQIIDEIARQQNHCFRLYKLTLPMPKDLLAPGLAEDDFHRLSVAYGLSFDAFDIGEIIKSNDIEDIIVEQKDDLYDARFVGKEME